jgi:hypothetical protein
VPASGDNVAITHNVNLNTNATVGNLTINASQNLTVEVGQTLTVNTGVTNNGTLTLQASSAGVGQLIHNSASVGNVIAGQYITGTAGTGKWVHISSPVVAAYNSMVQAPAQMIANASNGSIFRWDAATANWVAPSAVTDNFAYGVPVVNYTGVSGTFGTFTADLPATLTTAAGTLASGAVDFSAALAYNDGQASTAFGNPVPAQNVTEGWNHIANPWPVAYDLQGQQIAAANFGIASYINGAYEYYNTDGTGNSALRYLPTMGSFWYQRGAAGAANFTFERARRTATEDPTLAKTASQPGEYNFTLKSENAVSGKEDKTYLIFKVGANDSFNREGDIVKRNNDNGYHNMFTYASTTPLGLQQQSELKGGKHSVGMGFTHIENGVFTIKQLDANELDGSVVVTLEDKLENTLTVLNTNDYTFSHNTANAADRFVLHFQYSAIGLEETVENTAKKSAWYAKGQLFIQAHSNEQVSYQITDMSGKVVFEQKEAVVEGLNNIQLPAVKRGAYVLRVIRNGKQENIKFIY